MQHEATNTRCDVLGNSPQSKVGPHEDIVVLLTATIRPQIGNLLVITDPTQRAEQYNRAILRWSKLATRGAIDLRICENSDSLKSLRPTAEGCLISCASPSAELAERGKGACEAALIKEAIDALIRQNVICESTPILKVTGRLYVTNGRRFLKSVHKTVAAMESLSPRSDGWILGVASLTHRRLDTRVFVAPAAVLSRLMSIAKDIADDRIRHKLELENVLFDLVVAGGGPEYRPFAVLPQIRGISGSSGAKYGGSVSKQVARPFIQLAWQLTSHLR